MSFKLYAHQTEALDKLFSGAILCGGVGSGKTLTALAYSMKTFGKAKPIVVITTAKKRDSGDWENEAKLIELAPGNITVDSWNNIEKYINVTDAFFIFDEQRVVGYGKWSKMFIKIAKSGCPWIMLSATPGDTWMDYIPVFIANGYYKNKTEFINNHVEYDRFAKFPKVKAYHATGKLQALRNHILVMMPDKRNTVRHVETVKTSYPKDIYGRVLKERWNVFEDKPIETASEFTQCLRRIVGTSSERYSMCRFFLLTSTKTIVFYNYNYELELLREMCEELKDLGYSHAEWNGHKHEDIPDTQLWVYLVQYTAGAEGWNCTDTNQVLFYSPNYSYKIMEQAKGRIDRINTPFTDLYYTHLVSNSTIDKAVLKAIDNKTNFNESMWGKSHGKTRKQIPDVFEEAYSGIATRIDNPKE